MSSNPHSYEELNRRNPHNNLNRNNPHHNLNRNHPHSPKRQRCKVEEDEELNLIKTGDEVTFWPSENLVRSFTGTFLGISEHGDKMVKRFGGGICVAIDMEKL